jgi:hypothetical protein
VRVGPFIWSKDTDFAVFGGSAAVAVCIVMVGHLTGLSNAPVPEWMWIGLVLGIDVAHVWTTLARTYLDSDELARRPGLYAGLPIACWVTGVVLHHWSPLMFWRSLAYLAVFHFVRQQAGWVAIYRARSMDRSTWTRIIDDAAVYAATGYPLLVWHARLPRAFDWFVPGDFVALPAALPWLGAARVLYAVCLASFTYKELRRLLKNETFQAGKCLVVATTAFTWWIGIAATNSDFDFTATNVIVHGVPYGYLLWRYAKANARDRPGIVASKLVRLGVLVCLSMVLALAFGEEALWDRMVWHEREWLFGGAGARFELGTWAMALIVPLLALPQATHYALDAFLWRSKDKNGAQSAALGFA